MILNLNLNLSKLMTDLVKIALLVEVVVKAFMLSFCFVVRQVEVVRTSHVVGVSVRIVGMNVEVRPEVKDIVVTLCALECFAHIIERTTRRHKVLEVIYTTYT